MVIPKGSKAVFWGKVCEGAQQAGEDLKIRVTYRGPYTEDQHTAQSKIIEYGIRQNYNAIVLAPTHVDRAGPILKKAVASGIKIVLIDSNMDTPYHTSIVELDNYKAGQMAAVHAGFLVEGAGNVVLARHMENHASTHARELGILDTIKSHYPQVNVIADPYMGSSVGSAYRIMSGIIDRVSTIDRVFRRKNCLSINPRRDCPSKNLHRHNADKQKELSKPKSTSNHQFKYKPTGLRTLFKFRRIASCSI
ncbi:MAG: substrate-binding domain-containing protein [Desulfobacterium sp.]|nr:substrate-binding domain-containing protein [Desulfobacterium sp.]